MKWEVFLCCLLAVSSNSAIIQSIRTNSSTADRSFSAEEALSFFNHYNADNTINLSYEEILEEIAQLSFNPKFVTEWNNNLHLFEDFDQPRGQSLKCHQKNDSKVPNSVHSLRPQDVKVVGAIGDSLTAANGADAKTIIGLVINYRGISFSIGGDCTLQKVVTLPNILREFNAKIYGFSTGTGNQGSKNARFNVAKAGAIAEGTPEQANLLVDRMKSSPDINFEKDWKVITYFIGGNNLCRLCKDRKRHSAADYAKHVTDAIDILHKNIPRAFVNLVTVFDVRLVSELNRTPACAALHVVECKCGAYGSKEEEKELLKEAEGYRSKLRDVVNSGRWDTRDDFTVVVQPYLEQTRPPKKKNWLGKEVPDLSYFAPDCFHFSSKGHEACAVGLWNNMLEPVGNKRVSWVPGEAINCPSVEFPYFYTNKNTPSHFMSKHDENFEKRRKNGHKRLGPPEPRPSRDNMSYLSEHSTFFIFVVLGVALFGCVLAVTSHMNRRRLHISGQQQRSMNNYQKLINNY